MKAPADVRHVGLSANRTSAEACSHGKERATSGSRLKSLPHTKGLPLDFPCCTIVSAKSSLAAERPSLAQNYAA